MIINKIYVSVEPHANVFYLDKSKAKYIGKTFAYSKQYNSELSYILIDYLSSGIYCDY